VSRVVVGGSVAQLGLAVIGIAESIDVGNFETAEDAVVLLDFLSGPANDPNSLNRIPRAPGVGMVELVGVGVGNIVAHEIGHYSGNWHTEQFFGPANLMDQGGNLAGMLGVGPDGVFGSADDVDVDFGRDLFVPGERFEGIEDTLNAVAFGLSTPIPTLAIGFEVQPGRDRAVIHTRSAGDVATALLGSPTFDVTAIDPVTLVFGPARARPRDGGRVRDVDGDGLPDRLVHVPTPATGVAPGDDAFCVRGALADGTRFEGCDAVTTHPRGCAYARPVPTAFEVEGPENGDFEAGDLRGWDLFGVGGGEIILDDGTIDPAGPGGPVAPFEGRFAGLSAQSESSVQIWRSDLTLPSDLVAARLVWADHLQNFAGVFRPVSQEWRVQVLDPADDRVLATLFSTRPGDRLFQNWTLREADLTPFIGRSIRLAFTAQNGLFFFNVRLDAVEVRVRRRIEAALELRSGAPGPPGQGVIPVVLQGSPELDVSQIDPRTLGLGPDHVPPEHDVCEPGPFATHQSDWNRDGHSDLLVHFRAPASLLGSTEVCVAAATRDGREVRVCHTPGPTRSDRMSPPGPRPSQSGGVTAREVSP
jgi:hypothetical protein